MLDPSDRRLLLEALQPPPGYSLDHAVGTTYSLDLMALLAAPLAFSAFADADASASDPLILLEALRASAQRITLFCEAGRTYVPKADRLLFAHLEESVMECVAPRGGSFHPKVWLLRYTMEEDVAYRFLCLSRNLTFDRCWDTALVLNGRSRGRSKADNRPLAEFLRALPLMATRALTTSRAQALEDLASDILRVEWELPDGFESFAFHPLGYRHAASLWPFDGQRIDRLLVVSPFVSSSMLERLTERSHDNLLVSRPDQLDACDPDALDGYVEAYVMQDTAPQDDDDALEDSAMRGLHAKFYIADQGWHSTVWSGSANATLSAFERNVEFLVELTGKKSAVGIDEVLRHAGEHGVTFRTLLAPYLRSEDASAEPPAERALERDGTELRHRLAASGLELQVVTSSQDGLYDMVLTATSIVNPVASVSSLEAWPITRRSEIAAEQVDIASHELARFTALPLEKLTPFLAFRAVLCAGDIEITTDFVLNLPLIDAPASRQAELLRSMLSSRAEVLRYLLYLLSGDSTEAVRALAQDALSNGGGQAGSGGSLALPLLEALLRTLDRDPAKLVAIRRVVEELTSSEATADLLPDDWDAVWRAVDAAAGERAA
jgi:hypothetical protein